MPDQDDPVYDQPGTRDQKRSSSSPLSNSTSPGRTSFTRGDALDPATIKQRESNPNENTAGHSEGGATDGTGEPGSSFSFKPEGAESVAGSNPLNSNPTGGFGAGQVKNFFWGTKTRKRATLGGSITGLLFGGGILGFTILSGPGQLIQLSQILQRNFSNSQNASSDRTGKLIRYAGANDAGETRLGFLGRQYFRSTVAGLSNIGIEFQTNSNSGFKSATIDTEKLAEQYPELKGMSTTQQQDWLADKLKISPSELSSTGKNLFSVDGNDFAAKAVSSFTRSATGLLGDGTKVTAIKYRVIGKYLGIPSLFHPISRALESKYNKLLNNKERKAAIEAEETAEMAPTEAQADPAVNDAENSGFSGGVTKALTATAGACLVYSTANDVVKIDRYRIVLPAVIEATRLISFGEQVKSGQDVSAVQAGAVEENLSNAQGQSVWQGQALQATEGVTNPSGPNLPGQYKQAFSSQSTAASIGQGADDVIHKITLGALGAGAVCSTAGTVIQIAITLTSSAIGAIGDIVSGGTATPAEIAVLGAVWGAKEAANVGESAVSLHFLQNFVLSKTTDATLAKDAFSGPVGGDFLAEGARAGAAIGGAAEGAIPLTGTESSTLAAQDHQQSEHQFHSESFFARMFDVDDYRSLAGRLSDSLSSSFTRNIASGIGGIGGIGGDLLSSLSSIFLPKTQAVTAYNWGSPEYGIPSSLLDDSSMSNPYANAQDVAQVLDGVTGQDYISKAQTCFGVDINKDSGTWNVIAQSPVDTSSSTYVSADCGNTNDSSLPDWKRMVLFVFDTRTMQAAACYLGDDQSCQDVGDDSGGNSSTTSPTPPVNPGSLPTGTAQSFAKSLLANSKITKNGTDVTADLQAASNGQAATAGKPLSQTLLALLVYMSQSHTFNISALESGGSGHSGPGDPHYEGDAVDITALDGDPVANGGIGRTAHDQTLISQIAPLMPKGTGVGFSTETSGFGQSQCGTTPPLPSGITDFSDTCSHLHIQIPVGSP